VAGVGVRVYVETVEIFLLRKGRGQRLVTKARQGKSTESPSDCLSSTYPFYLNYGGQRSKSFLLVFRSPNSTLYFEGVRYRVSVWLTSRVRSTQVRMASDVVPWISP